MNVLPELIFVTMMLTVPTQLDRILVHAKLVLLEMAEIAQVRISTHVLNLLPCMSVVKVRAEKYYLNLNQSENNNIRNIRAEIEVRSKQIVILTSSMSII